MVVHWCLLSLEWPPQPPETSEPILGFKNCEHIVSLLINYSLPSLRMEKSYNVWNIQVFGDAPCWWIPISRAPTSATMLKIPMALFQGATLGRLAHLRIGQIPDVSSLDGSFSQLVAHRLVHWTLARLVRWTWLMGCQDLEASGVIPNEDKQKKHEKKLMKLPANVTVVVHAFRNAPKALENLAVHLLQKPEDKVLLTEQIHLFCHVSS